MNLTREMIMAMEAGPEMDELICIHIFNSPKPEPRNDDGSGFMLTNDFRWQECGKGWFSARCYSSNIAAAWEVVEKIGADGFDCGTPHMFGRFISKWWARFPGNRGVPISGDTAPLAICKAALLTTLEAQ